MTHMGFNLLFTALPAAMLVAVLGNLGSAADPPKAPPGAAAQSWSSGSETRMALLQERLRTLPEDAGANLKLGGVYLQRARETADPAYYGKAEGVLQRVLELHPEDPAALATLGGVALARHQFQEALAWGERAKHADPTLPAAYGVIGDALVELGRYPQAFQAYQEMLNRRPVAVSYARVSYARELTGDIDGAIAAMRMAADWSGGEGEAAAWTRVMLGNLLWTYRRDGPAAAEREYRLALGRWPGYPPGLAGLARVKAGQQALDESIALARKSMDALPSLESAILLSDLLHASRRGTEAQDQDALVRVMERLMSGAGVEPDPEMVLFEADRGDPNAAVELARRVYRARPSAKSADALAWALFKVGDPASAALFIDEALRWGSQDPATHYHAAQILLGLGNADAAADHLDVVARGVLPVRYAEKMPAREVPPQA